MAPTSPPLTGASSIRAPRAAARCSSRRATAGAMLLVSIRMVPGWIALNTPSGPSRTRSTSGESGSIVTMRVARRATSAGDAARAAPAATSSSTGPWLRLWTTRLNPFLMRFLAIGRPMTPSPMNPTVSLMSVYPAKLSASVNVVISVALRVSGDLWTACGNVQDSAILYVLAPGTDRELRAIGPHRIQLVIHEHDVSVLL